MSAPAESRYQNAKALEAAHAERVHGAVRFHASGFALGRWLRRGEPGAERVIRFAVHAGQAVEIALPTKLADQLGRDLIGKEVA